MMTLTSFRKILSNLTIYLLVGLLFLCYRAFIQDARFFSVQNYEYIQELVHKNNSNTYKLTLHSKFDYLGIVQISFNSGNLQKVKDKKFKMKILDINRNRIYENEFHFNDIVLLPEYPFGFPLITNSKDKDYQFIFQTTGPILSLNQKGPNIVMVHQYGKKSVLNPIFWINKIHQYLSESFIRKTFYFYTFPAIIYILSEMSFLVFKINIYKGTFFQNLELLFRPSFLFILLIMFLSALLLPTTNDILVLLASALWLLLILIYEYPSRVTLNAALLFLLFTIALLISNMMSSAVNTVTWSFMLLFVGTIKELYLSSLSSYFSNKYISKIKMWTRYIDNYLINKLKFRTVYLKVSKKSLIQIQFVGLSLILFVLAISAVFTKAMIYRDRVLKEPKVQVMEPVLVYHSTKVVLYGKSFGEKKDERYRIMRNGKEIRTDYWDDSKIIFTIPLDWRPGEYSIWIERPIEWNTETIIEKTKPQTIKVLPVTGKITPDDDLYFKQMDTLRKETKEINGF